MICIPSKGRLKSPVIKGVADEGLPHEVWVHHTEAADYRYAYPAANIFAHNFTDIAEIRQMMLEQSRAFNRIGHWQIDDDVSKVYYRPGLKHLPCSFTRWINEMESELEHWPTVGIAAPSLRQYAWSSSQPALNGRGMGVTWIRSDGPWEYRPDRIEDWDIIFQVWAAGMHTVRFTDWAFDMPQMGTNPGGMAEAYAAGWQEPRREATFAEWPQYVKPWGDGMRMNMKSLTKPQRV